MTRIHGKSVDYSFNAVALEDELNQVVMTVDVPAADTTSFADAYQTALAGKKTVQTAIQGTYDPTASQGDATLFANVNGGAKVSTIFDLTGSGPAADNPEYQCTASGLSGALVASYKLNFPVGDKASYSATIQHSGLTSRAIA